MRGVSGSSGHAVSPTARSWWSLVRLPFRLFYRFAFAPLFAIAFPLLVLFAAWVSIEDLGSAFRALTQNGHPGTFVVKTVACSKFCTWEGEFVSDDKSVIRHHVEYVIRPSGVVGVGGRTRAIDTGGAYVYVESGSVRCVEDIAIVILLL